MQLERYAARYLPKGHRRPTWVEMQTPEALWVERAQFTKWSLCPLCFVPSGKLRRHLRSELGGSKWCVNPACSSAFPCNNQACPYFLPECAVTYPLASVWPYFTRRMFARLEKRYKIPPGPYLTISKAMREQYGDQAYRFEVVRKRLYGI